jgi:hypothetical protein
MYKLLPAVDWSIEGTGCVFFLVIWYLLIISIDIKWIMLKEFIDGSLDNTCTLIRSNPGKRILCPPIWFQSAADGFV